MSDWNHSCCDACWMKIHVPSRVARGGSNEPGRLKPELCESLLCCWCGSRNESGIYVRSDPDKLRCGGKHEPDQFDRMDEETTE